MKIALCQIDTTVGDFAGNVAKVVAFAARARSLGAELAVFPELAVCGYPPEDLLTSRAFLAAHDHALQELGAAVPADLPVLVGCVERNPSAAQGGGRPLHNAVALLHGGEVRIVARKSLLPTYDVFDESRYFEPWQRPQENVVAIAGTRVGVVVCEDGWNDERFFGERHYALDPVERVVAAGAQLVVNLSASPWSLGKETLRQRMVEAAAARHGVPMIYVNLVGGDVELQFDGGSLAVKATGVACQPVLFAEALQIVDTDAPWNEVPPTCAAPPMHHAAIVQGIRAYAEKFGFPRALIGLSGGIDSALTAALAVDALGAANVAGIAMPSAHSSGHSVADALQLADNLGIVCHQLPIEPLRVAFEQALAPVFAGTEPGLAEENLQARIRGTLLMAYANKHGHLLLTTGNKSESAVGYCTLYGDTNGALAPIADLWKTEVWALSRWLNRDGERIPWNSIEKPPSAELRPDQLDTDSLPPYPELDPVLRLLVEEQVPVAEIALRTGMAREVVAELQRKVQASEFKRYQYPPTLRVSERCWSGRRMPVSHRFRER
ncbi:MAG: NAD+ synthase [Planctomycetes bacterium]|nr:NAD+ synthase [Planctomycetota bacterium]